MSDSSHRRDALVARYRTISLERVRKIRARLDDVVAADREALTEVRRELHTLKGDSHLLGMVRIGEVARAAEDRVLAPGDLEVSARAISIALDAVELALCDETRETPSAQDALRNALIALAAQLLESSHK